MSSNPYRLADARQRRARARDGGGWEAVAGLGPAAVAVAAAALVRHTVLGFLDAEEPAVSLGVAALCARLGLLLTALTALGSYAHVVRGPDRGVLDLHPVLHDAWFTARLGSLARGQLPWLAGAVAFLAPLGFWGVPWGALGAAGVTVVGSWAAGLTVGMGVSLGALKVALDERYAGLLDAIRGYNPRMQAALIWAPGVALGVSGMASLAASGGLEALLLGAPMGWVGLGVPFVVAGMGLAAARAGVPTIERVPAVLGEIDAAWAQEERADESGVVYLEWAVRLVPASLRRELLRELRHLWRGQRAWVTGSWAMAVLGALAGWAGTRGGFAAIPAVPLAGGVVLGACAVRLGATDPEWLESALDLPRVRIVLARAVALTLVAQAVVLASVATGLVRTGRTVLPAAVGVEVGVVICAGLGALAGARWRRRGLAAYLPMGLTIWALGVSVWGGA